jgi:hypothetical protein
MASELVATATTWRKIKDATATESEVWQISNSPLPEQLGKSSVGISTVYRTSVSSKSVNFDVPVGGTTGDGYAYVAGYLPQAGDPPCANVNKTGANMLNCLSASELKIALGGAEGIQMVDMSEASIASYYGCVITPCCGAFPQATTWGMGDTLGDLLNILGMFSCSISISGLLRIYFVVLAGLLVCLAIFIVPCICLWKRPELREKVKDKVLKGSEAAKEAKAGIEQDGLCVSTKECNCCQCVSISATIVVLKECIDFQVFFSEMQREAREKAEVNAASLRATFPHACCICISFCLSGCCTKFGRATW